MRAKSLKSCKKRRGQAALEYVLLVAVSVLVFGYMFTVIRQQMYRLWVCEMGPRVQSAAGCRDAQKCFQSLQSAAGGQSQVPPFCGGQ